MGLGSASNEPLAFGRWQTTEGFDFLLDRSAAEFGRSAIVIQVTDVPDRIDDRRLVGGHFGGLDPPSALSAGRWLRSEGRMAVTPARTTRLSGRWVPLITSEAKRRHRCLDIPLDWKVYVPGERTIQIGKEHNVETFMLAPAVQHNGIEHRSLAARVPMSVPVADSQFRQALGAEGFDVLDEIAVTGLDPGGDRHSYRILVTYHPTLARRAIETEPGVGLVLPTNVVIRADGEVTEVEALDPAIMGETTRNPALGAIIIDLRGRLERAIHTLRSCVDVIERPAFDGASMPRSKPDEHLAQGKPNRRLT